MTYVVFGLFHMGNPGEQGYLGVENVLSADEANEPRRVTDEFVAKSRQVTEKDDVFDLEPATAQTRPNCAG